MSTDLANLPFPENHRGEVSLTVWQQLGLGDACSVCAFSACQKQKTPAAKYGREGLPC